MGTCALPLMRAARDGNRRHKMLGFDIASVVFRFVGGIALIAAAYVVPVNVLEQDLGPTVLYVLLAMGGLFTVRYVYWFAQNLGVFRQSHALAKLRPYQTPDGASTYLSQALLGGVSEGDLLAAGFSAADVANAKAEAAVLREHPHRRR